jgi:hypothetical protein
LFPCLVLSRLCLCSRLQTMQPVICALCHVSGFRLPAQACAHAPVLCAPVLRLLYHQLLCACAYAAPGLSLCHVICAPACAHLCSIHAFSLRPVSPHPRPRFMSCLSSRIQICLSFRAPCSCSQTCVCPVPGPCVFPVCAPVFPGYVLCALVFQCSGSVPRFCALCSRLLSALLVFCAQALCPVPQPCVLCSCPCASVPVPVPVPCAPGSCLCALFSVLCVSVFLFVPVLLCPCVSSSLCSVLCALCSVSTTNHKPHINTNTTRHKTCNRHMQHSTCNM